MRRSVLFVALAVFACGSEVVDGTSGSTSTGNGGAGVGASSSSTTSGSGGSGAGSQGGTGGIATGGGGGTGVSCNPSGVVCDGPTPICPPGEVPEVVGGCWGNCVPILTCATEPNCDNCQGGFCAEYVSFVTEYRCVLPNLMCSALACSCLEPYFCVAPFDACSEAPAQGSVSCGCTAC
jgi:hypothetical protein